MKKLFALVLTLALIGASIGFACDAMCPASLAVETSCPGGGTQTACFYGGVICYALICPLRPML